LDFTKKKVFKLNLWVGFFWKLEIVFKALFCDVFLESEIFWIKVKFELINEDIEGLKFEASLGWGSIYVQYTLWLHFYFKKYFIDVIQSDKQELANF
jgi:hypothetical protein